MAWALWMTRNKLLIERVSLRQATDSVFKLLAFMQQWRPFSKRQDKTMLDAMIDGLQGVSRRLSTTIFYSLGMFVLLTYVIFSTCMLPVVWTLVVALSIMQGESLVFEKLDFEAVLHH